MAKCIVVVTLLAMVLSCMHDTGMPIQNDLPDLAQLSAADTSVVSWPDSFAFSVQVQDFNDSILNLDTASWPGSFVLHDTLLDKKRLELFYATNRIGYPYADTLVILDQWQAALEVPYVLKVVCRDSLAYPARDAWWITLQDTQGAWTSLGPPAPQLGYGTQCYFEPAGGETRRVTFYLLSKFGLVGDFTWEIDYWLLHSNVGSFDLKFFCTDTLDTNEYAGSGSRFTVGMQGRSMSYTLFDPRGSATVSNLSGYEYGPIKFSRQDSTFRVWHKPLLGEYEEFPHVGWIEPADTTYIYIKLAVTGASRIMCTFLDFELQQGELFLP
ncbi:MAG: hypothetical protein GF398_12955 [Chitinivibrionales bacterium]|nr:hypothetical protein [Chitinivibrionales bacterium]